MILPLFFVGVYNSLSFWITTLYVHFIFYFAFVRNFDFLYCVVILNFCVWFISGIRFCSSLMVARSGFYFWYFTVFAPSIFVSLRWAVELLFFFDFEFIDLFSSGFFFTIVLFFLLSCRTFFVMVLKKGCFHKFRCQYIVFWMCFLL